MAAFGRNGIGWLSVVGQRCPGLVLSVSPGGFYHGS
jgi:hypothetical protein